IFVERGSGCAVPPRPMRRRFIRTLGIFLATIISTAAVFAFLKKNFTEESNQASDVKFTSSIPSRPAAPPPSPELIQVRSDDPVAAFLIEPRVRSREMARELVPLPRPRPKRL